MRLRAVGLIATLALGLLAAPLAAEAQHLAKVPRIGLLCWTHCGGVYYEAFWTGLRELGYVPYRNIDFDNRSAGGDQALLQNLADELVRLKVQLIVADTTLSARAAKNATKTIPIVAITDDPVGTGLVASLGRPGGNITGLSSIAPELSAKRLELLKETVPAVSRVAILWNPGTLAVAPGSREVQIAAQALGLTVQFREVGSLGDLDRAFAAMARERVDALIVFAADISLLIRLPEHIVNRAAQTRLPAIYDLSDLVHIGGLMSYGPSVRELYRRAAAYVDKILKGAKPADLPVEQPTRFELVVNLKTAKALGLTIPQSLLIRADKVIE